MGAVEKHSELPLVIDRDAGTPLPAQLAAALRDAIDRATLRPGEGVPATRRLASSLGVARGVVVAAYEQLIAEGYLRAEHGRGTVVNPELAPDPERLGGVAGATGAGAGAEDPRAARGAVRSADSGTTIEGGIRIAEAPGPAGRPGGARHAPDADPDRLADADPTPRPPLAPGTPLTDATERPAWRAAWRAAVARADRRPPALGDPALRREIVEHLRLVRGTARPARDVIVTAGAREGLGLLLTALGTTRGHGLVVGVEDPGYPSLRSVAARHGARIVSLPVDAEGLRTDRLPEGLLDLVIVTPSHQYPVGGSLPLPRRRELLEWAGRTGVVIVEDDYDSELRHAGGPLPALAALDDAASGSVMTLGTFSSTVTPALAAGFLLAPRNLRALLEPVRQDLGSPVSAVVQLALADYLATGELRRNIARVRRRHAARRDLISERFAGAGRVRVRPMSGGLHAVLEFEGVGASRREAAVVEAAARETTAFPAGLGVAALGAYWQHRSAGRAAGVVLGMGGPDDAEFAAAIDRLRRILLAV
ncbi:MocR-like pyridoxine biosynthesis transcription factor PdxR [Leucobacter muris]|uniref:MocR-like pyridoxine biosynthesis transcription factor PdxR n=1 Tax=Leucobacter muris TaxID=1935379 RepID=UPI001E459E99|nr:PLP-dependent aminotransferase family protein [Leucobacter muris]